MYRTIPNALLSLLLLPTFSFALFETYQAERAYRAGDYAQSSGILADQNKDSKTLFNLGVSEYRTKSNEALKRSVENFEQAQQDPKLKSSAQFNQANALAYQGEYEKALKVLEELRKESPSEAVEHNYEIVKKLLEQKKKQDEEKKKKDEKKDKQDKDEQDKKEKEQQDQEKKKKKEKKDKGKKPDQGQDEPGDKSGQEKEKKKQPEKKPGAEETLPQDLQQMLKAAQSEDKKQTKQLLKSQLKQQQSPSGQKNW